MFEQDAFNFTKRHFPKEAKQNLLYLMDLAFGEKVEEDIDYSEIGHIEGKDVKFDSTPVARKDLIARNCRGEVEDTRYPIFLHFETV